MPRKKDETNKTKDSNDTKSEKSTAPRKELGTLHMSDVMETEEKKEFEMITLKFAKGLVGDEFQGKDGNTYREIKIPNEDKNDKSPWKSFVAPSSRIHEDQYIQNAMFLKLPAEGHTTVKQTVLVGTLPDGRNDWKNEIYSMSNKDIKKELDASRPRESFKDKLAEKQDEVRTKEAAKAKNPVTKDKQPQKKEQAL